MHRSFDRFQRAAPSIRSNLVFRSDRPSALGSLEVGDEIELGWRLLLANQLVLHMHDDITLLICPWERIFRQRHTVKFHRMSRAPLGLSLAGRRIARTRAARHMAGPARSAFASAGIEWVLSRRS